MFLNESSFNFCLIENNGNINLLFQITIGIFLLFIFSSSAVAQWVNNPAINTRLVVDAVNPINISSIDDLKGGAFIFWEENKNSSLDFTGSDHKAIYFLHVDGNGKVSFRADGKKISENPGKKSNPVAVSNLPSTAVVVYKDFTQNKSGDLYAQKLLDNGNLLWQKNGIKISQTDKEILEYTVSSGRRGNVYVSYLTRDPEAINEFELHIQKINTNGKLIFEQDGINIYSTNYRVSQPTIIADERGGAFLFWLDNHSNKSTLLAQRIDSTGKASWKKPISISGDVKNVISYSTGLTSFSSVYVAWQVYNDDKDIYHQLVSTSGKALWDPKGRRATAQKGNQINPQVLAEDSTIILSWTNEINDDRNLFIQKFDLNGKQLWKEDGSPVIELKGAQFGQKLIEDGKGGAILGWIDRRVDSLRGNIFAQRITTSGLPAWDTTGIPVASSNNTEKSYLSVVSDKRGGAIFIFKDMRSKKGEIFGQKIFNTGTYVSQIIGFIAEAEGDSVKVSWYSANELGKTQYSIERTTQSDSSSTDWQMIGTVYSDGKSPAKFYEYYDSPDVAGTIYYRVIQSDNLGNFQPSDVSKINYLEGSADITVAQNSPNPFSSETIIQFYLPQAANVSVEFFNSRVEEVKKINNESFPQGKNEIRFSSDGLEPGIYFYRFKIDDFIDVKKMVITN